VWVWRVTRGRYAANALSGEGAARAGNRWNSKGVRVAYSSASRALAVLEMLLHVTRETVPEDTVLVPMEVPDQLITELQQLPKGWDEFPYRETAKAVGDKWVREKSSAALLVPSAVLRPERNMLINPAHPEFPRIRVHAAEEKALDPRVFSF
jgi:RES domain-containing protein